MNLYDISILAFQQYLIRSIPNAFPKLIDAIIALFNPVNPLM